MVLNTHLVLQQVLEMKSKIENDEMMTKEQYKEFYSYLAQNVPTLFEIVWKNEVNYMQFLHEMIKNTQRVGDNSISQHDADVEIGQMLADEYIHSNIDMSKENKNI